MVFLDLNGVCLDQPSERLYQAMMDIAAHTLGKDGLAAILRELAGAHRE